MANGNGYSSSQIMAMQKDAVRRVNEMQRLARTRLAQSTGGPDSPSGLGNRQEHVHVHNPVEETFRQQVNQQTPPLPSAGDISLAEPVISFNEGHRQGDGPNPPPAAGALPPVPIGGLSGGLAGPFQGILDRLGLDQETVMLLVLILLMVNEGADISLILALGYILL